MSEARTQADRVYAQLRDDIIAGNIQPGSQLAFARLKEKIWREYWCVARSAHAVVR